jgi:hypothetical protein
MSRYRYNHQVDPPAPFAYAVVGTPVDGGRSDEYPAQIDPAADISVVPWRVVEDLAYGWSPDEIRRQHPHLTLAEVHAAMGYYYDHQPEIDAEITAEFEDVDRAMQTPQRSPVWLKLKAQGLIK